MSLLGMLFSPVLSLASYVIRFVTNPIQSRLKRTFPRIKTTATSLFTTAAVLLICLWISILLYWSFYYTYIPTVSHVHDVNLIFGSDCDSERGVCSFPSANLSLISAGQQPVLARGQEYKVSLELDMPESPVNRELGMFMVKLDLYTKHGEVVRSTHRAVSSMINYKSTLLRVSETVFFLPLYLFGYYDQKQSVLVQLYKSFTEDPFKPTFGAFLEVQSRFVEIYKATLRIDAQFSGLRYILHSWPITSSFIGVGILMFFFTLVTLVSWYNLYPGQEAESEEQYFSGEYSLLDESPEVMADDAKEEKEETFNIGDDADTRRVEPLVEEIRQRLSSPADEDKL